MTVSGDPLTGRVTIVLSYIEAKQICVDHGEGAMILPCDDTIGNLMKVAAALREARP